jgi:hypothetical protein
VDKEVDEVEEENDSISELLSIELPLLRQSNGFGESHSLSKSDNVVVKLSDSDTCSTRKCN